MLTACRLFCFIVCCRVCVLMSENVSLYWILCKWIKFTMVIISTWKSIEKCKNSCAFHQNEWFLNSFGSNMPKWRHSFGFCCGCWFSFLFFLLFFLVFVLHLTQFSMIRPEIPCTSLDFWFGSSGIVTKSFQNILNSMRLLTFVQWEKVNTISQIG